MPIELFLSATDHTDDEVQALARELREALSDEGVEADLVKAAAPTGTKGGEWEVIGQLVLKGLSIGGGGAALFNVLKTYLQRKPTLEIEVKRKGGDTIKVRAANFNVATTIAIVAGTTRRNYQFINRLYSR